MCGASACLSESRKGPMLWNHEMQHLLPRFPFWLNVAILAAMSVSVAIPARSDSRDFTTSSTIHTMALVHVRNFSFCHCIFCHNTLAILEHPKYTQPCPVSIWTAAHLFLTACVSCCRSKQAADYVHGMLVEAASYTKLLQRLSTSSDSTVHVWKRGTEMICTDYRFIVAKLGPWDEINWAFEPSPKVSMWQFLPIRSYRYTHPIHHLSTPNLSTEPDDINAHGQVDGPSDREHNSTTTSSVE